MLFGIKKNKCMEPAISFRGVWDFTDAIAAGEIATQSFTLPQNTPEFPVVVVTSENEYDPTEIEIYGYVPQANDTVIICVKNNTSATISNISVNFVVI